MLHFRPLLSLVLSLICSSKHIKILCQVKMGKHKLEHKPKKTKAFLPLFLLLYIPFCRPRFRMDVRAVMLLCGIKLHLNLVCPRFKRESEGGRSFSVSTSRLWNMMPAHIKNQPNLTSFKKSIFKHFMDSYKELDHFIM